MPTPEHPTMTVKAAAAALDVHPNTVRNWVNRGLLDAHRLPSGFARPYVTAVTELAFTLARGDSGTGAETITAAMLDAEADHLELRAAALRRAAEILGEFEQAVEGSDA